MNECNTGSRLEFFFYHNCHSMSMKKMLFYVKSCSLFDTFLKYLFNIIQVSFVVCYKFVFKEFCKKNYIYANIVDVNIIGK